MTTAFDPITVGRNRLSNRIVMSPMTRSRAYGAGATPTDLMASYYAQRASAGLIITEGTQPSSIGQGYPHTPGLHSQEQVRAWRPVTEAVHRRGGVIFAQLMHTGRIGHPSLLDQPQTPVGASPVRARGQVFTPVGPLDLVTPEELSHEGVLATIDDFAHAAVNAVSAGFDWVELHGANGYLLHQFLSTNANLRNDAWGGSPEKRVRLTIGATEAVANAIGADRTALRISPANPLNDIVDEDWAVTYPLIVAALKPLGLAYLHVLESGAPELTPRLHEQWDSSTDLLSFGVRFLANPDLPARPAAGGPFNNPDMTKAYGGEHSGYTDYPALHAA